MSRTHRKNGSAIITVILSLAVSMSMFLTAFAESNDSNVSSGNTEVTEQSLFAGGSGSVEDPYQVATADQLDHIREELDASFVLIADIDLSGYENWQPIGEFQSKSDAPEDAEIPKEEAAFRGSLDGNGHTISNLTIDAPQSMAVGLFGCALGNGDGKGFIKNLTLENVNVNGAYLVGGAVGLQFMNFEVDDIILTGTNTLSGMQGVGGIVGTGFDWIRNCNATADITILGDGGACARMIAGGPTYSSIENCTANNGTITVEGEACWGFGGICGAPYAAAEIKNCDANSVTIIVSGENGRLVGGIAGFAGTYGESEPASIENCTADGINITVSDTTTCVGGIVGGPKEESDGSSVMSSYAVKGCSVSGSISGGAEKIGSVAGDETNAVELDCTSDLL